MKISFACKPRSAVTAAAVILLLVSGCAGGKGFRLEMEAGGSGGQKIRAAEMESAAWQGPESRPKELPEATADEHEQLGDAHLGRGNLYLAYLQYEKSLKLKPGNLRAEYKKGLALVMGERNDDAIAQFEAVLKRDPKFAPAHEGLGRACFQKRDFARAEEHLRTAVALDHTLWRAYNYLGNLHDFRREYDRAALEYVSAIAIRPDQGFLYNNLGVSYSAAGRQTEAVAAFTRAIERGQREPKVYNNLGLALARLGRDEEALEAFRAGGSEAQAYNNLGCVHLERGNHGEAVRCFEKAIALDPAFYAKASENLKKARAGLGVARAQ
jgi:tetratricopeptide (TPR) repeat protein